MRCELYISFMLGEELFTIWTDLPFIPRIDDAITLKSFIDLSTLKKDERDLIETLDFKVNMIEWNKDQDGVYLTIFMLGLIDGNINLNVYDIYKEQKKLMRGGKKDE